MYPVAIFIYMLFNFSSMHPSLAYQMFHKNMYWYISSSDGIDVSIPSIRTYGTQVLESSRGYNYFFQKRQYKRENQFRKDVVLLELEIKECKNDNIVDYRVFYLKRYSTCYNQYII